MTTRIVGVVLAASLLLPGCAMSSGELRSLGSLFTIGSGCALGGPVGCGVATTGVLLDKAADAKEAEEAALEARRYKRH